MGLFCCAPAMARGGTQAEEASVEVSSELFEPARPPVGLGPCVGGMSADVWWEWGVAACVCARGGGPAASAA